jgi:NTE family protein
MPKRGLVLSGGGAKGAFQAGVLEYLHEKGKLDFDVVCGVSVGALNATMVAQGEFEKLKELWLGIKEDKDILKKNSWLGIILGKNSLNDNQPLKELIQRYVDRKKIIDNFTSQGKILKIGVVSLTTGEYKAISPTHSSFLQMLLASTTIPVMFKPFNISAADYQMVDGGVRNITPLKDAIDAGADEIVVVLASPRWVQTGKKDYKNILQVIARTFDILSNEVYINDIENCEWYNVHMVDDGEHRKIDLKIVEPAEFFMDTLEFHPKAIRKAIEIGKETAAEKFGY